MANPPTNRPTCSPSRRPIGLARSSFRAKVRAVEDQQADLVAKWSPVRAGRRLRAVLAVINGRLAKADAALREFDATGDRARRRSGSEAEARHGPGPDRRRDRQWGRYNTDESVR